MKKFFLIAGVVILVVIIGGGIYVYTHKEKLANMAIDQAFNGIEKVTLDNLTSNYNAEDIKKLVEEARAKVSEQGFKSPQFQSLVATFQDVYADKKVDSLEVQSLVESLKKFAE